MQRTRTRDDLAAGVEAWVDAHVGELVRRPLIALHVDRLPGITGVGELLEASLSAFAALATRVAALGDPGRAGLVLPLRAGSVRLGAAVPPTPEALAEQLLASEAPSLCVVAWAALAARERIEEYRAPLPFAFAALDAALPADRTLDAYYHEQGGTAAPERAVHVEAYPPRYA